MDVQERDRLLRENWDKTIPELVKILGLSETRIWTLAKGMKLPPKSRKRRRQIH